MLKITKSIIFFVLFVFIPLSLLAINPVYPEQKTDKMNPGQQSQEELLIVWTSGDPDVAHKMVFMYAHNAMRNGWWEKVTLLVWGPSSKLSSENQEIRDRLVQMKEDGVNLLACKGCADQYGVSSRLEELGIEVKYTGTYLTDCIKSGRKIITF